MCVCYISRQNNQFFTVHIYTLPLHTLSVSTCRADTESTSEHLEALRKLSSDLEEQRATLEDLRDQRQAIMPRLSLLDKELVKQQVTHHSRSSVAAF